MLLLPSAGPLTTSLFRFLLLTSFGLLARAASGPTNRTIDDQTGDSATGTLPVYSPPDLWKNGAACTDCFVRPDKTKTSSWHDSTIDPGGVPRNITLTFTGTAIYVYAIVPNQVPDATTTVNVTFALNNNQGPSSFFHEPTTSTDFQYDVPVFFREGLQNKEHQLTISPTAGTEGSLFLFDYAKYTFDDTPKSTSKSAGPTSSAPAKSADATKAPDASTASSSSGLPVGAILGIVVGVLALIAGVLLLFFCLRRKRRPQRSIEDRQVLDPTPQPTMFAPQFNLPASFNSATAAFATAGLTAPRASQGNVFSGRDSEMVSRPLPTPGAASASLQNDQRVIGAVSPRTTVFAASGSAAVAAAPLGTKARMRETELQRQLADARAALDSQQDDVTLNVQRPSIVATDESFPSHESHAAYGGAGSGRRGSDEESLLRDRVDTLQAEVDRLRLASADAPPPAYDGGPVSPVSTMPNPHSVAQSEGSVVSDFAALTNPHSLASRLSEAPKLRLHVPTPEKNVRDFAEPSERRSSIRKSMGASLMPPSEKKAQDAEWETMSAVSTLPNPHSSRASVSTLGFTLPNPH